MAMDKTLIATALKYDRQNDDVPKLIAKGMGSVAQNIMDIADQNNIPTYNDEKLSKQLYNLSLGEGIPEELYEIVAQILVFIANVDSMMDLK